MCCAHLLTTHAHAHAHAHPPQHDTHPPPHPRIHKWPLCRSAAPAPHSLSTTSLMAARHLKQSTCTEAPLRA
jgi:hypothetical protein